MKELENNNRFEKHDSLVWLDKIKGDVPFIMLGPFYNHDSMCSTCIYVNAIILTMLCIVVHVHVYGTSNLLFSNNIFIATYMIETCTG